MIFKNTLFWLSLGILITGSVMGVVMAKSVPNIIVYESALLNTNKEPITSEHTLRFSLWKSSDATPADRNGDGSINTLSATYAGWQEVHTLTPENNGFFSVKLGSQTDLPDTFDALQQKYLQIEVKPSGSDDTFYQILDVNGDNIADTIDRQTIGSMPFAHQAKYATGASDGTFTIDANDSQGSGRILLQFGTLLSRYLAYDIDQGRFILNDDTEIQGNLTVQSINNIILDTSAFSEKRTLSLPNANTTLVGDNTAQELTNKTLDAEKNTLVHLGTDDLETFAKEHIFRVPYPAQFISAENQIDAFLREESSRKYIEARTQSEKQTLVVHTALEKPKNFREWSGNKVTLDVLTTGTDVSRSSISVRVNTVPVLIDIGTGGIWQEITVPLATGTWMSSDTPLDIEVEMTASNGEPSGIGDITLYYSGY